MFTTPILFLVFNRPDTTVQVFEQIRKIKPAYLYVAADGPRESKPGEKEICEKVRTLVLSQIDWECEIKTLFRDENLGCGKAVSGAINWFFENVEEGIILEDDTLPDLSFFEYCKILLQRYRHEEGIMHVGANNFQFGIKRGDGDYYYSILSHIWGWATWRRAWSKYHFHLTPKILISDDLLSRAFNDLQVKNYYQNIFHQLERNEIDTWDYQWFLALIRNSGIAICPNVNLVQNIGFGNGATHTLTEPEWNSLNVVKPILSFLQPSGYEINYDADLFALRKLLGFRENNEEIIKRVSNNVFFEKLKIIISKVFR